MAKLKPIGEGSMADEYGYDFELLVSWLEDISAKEQETAEKNPRYAKRADKLDTAVCMLQELMEE